MKNLRNERGVALVTSLLLTLIALAMIMAILYAITWQTKLSAAHKQYKTALEAAQGGGPEIFAKQIIPEVFANVTGQRLHDKFTGIDLVPASGACLQAKLGIKTSGWETACGTDTNLFDPTVKSDVRMTLNGINSNSKFNVYAKIVDTVPGNSDMSGYDEVLDGGGGVTGGSKNSSSAGVSPKHIPAMYRIEVQGEKQVNPEEKARLSVLYAY